MMVWQICAVKQVEDIPEEKMLVFKKRAKKAVKMLKKNVTVKPKSRIMCLENKIRPTKTDRSRFLKDEIVDNFESEHVDTVTGESFGQDLFLNDEI